MRNRLLISLIGIFTALSISGCSVSSDERLPSPSEKISTSESGEPKAQGAEKDEGKGNGKNKKNPPEFQVPEAKGKTAEDKWRNRYTSNKPVIVSTLTTLGFGSKKAEGDNRRNFVKSCRIIKRQMGKTNPDNGAAALKSNLNKPIAELWSIKGKERDRKVGAVFGSSIQYVCPELLTKYRDYVS